MAEKKWSASNYRANKTKRLASIETEWVTNPETGSSFFLRRVGAMAAVIAGYMHTVRSLADETMAAWQEKGVDVGKPALSVVTAEKIAESERELQMMARIVNEACVIPKLLTGATGEDELDPSELDDRDVMFIFRYATGQVGMKGGEVVNMADLKRTTPKQPGRRTRTRNDGAQLRDAAQPLAKTG